MHTALKSGSSLWFDLTRISIYNENSTGGASVYHI